MIYISLSVNRKLKDIGCSIRKQLHSSLLSDHSI